MGFVHLFSMPCIMSLIICALAPLSSTFSNQLGNCLLTVCSNVHENFNKQYLFNFLNNKVLPIIKATIEIGKFAGIVGYNNTYSHFFFIHKSSYKCSDLCLFLNFRCTIIKRERCFVLVWLDRRSVLGSYKHEE